MNIRKTIFPFLSFLLLCSRLAAQPHSAASFKVIPLGVKGGLDESNLSAYMIAPEGSDSYICADAGTLRHGIDVAVAAKSISGSSDEILKKNISGYLISHPHLDHVAGLIMNSPEDSPKNIYAFPSVIETLRDKYFTWKAWANFTNEGEAPRLNKYSYVALKAREKIALAGTSMEVTAFPLSHGPGYESSAFVISHGSDFLLYLGDTGADQIEKSDRLQQLWEQIAPMVKDHALKAIFIEVSFPDAQPDKQLFGHLTPRLLMAELEQLGKLSGVEALKTVPIVITHMKSFGLQEKALIHELTTDNKSGLKLVIPVQGKLLRF